MKWMVYHVVFSHVVESGVLSRWIYLCVNFSCAILMKNIVHIMRLTQYSPRYICSVYHLMVLDGEWINGTC